MNTNDALPFPFVGHLARIRGSKLPVSADCGVLHIVALQNRNSSGVLLQRRFLHPMKVFSKLASATGLDRVDPLGSNGTTTRSTTELDLLQLVSSDGHVAGVSPTYWSSHAGGESAAEIQS